MSIRNKLFCIALAIPCLLASSIAIGLAQDPDDVGGNDAGDFAEPAVVAGAFSLKGYVRGEDLDSALRGILAGTSRAEETPPELYDSAFEKYVTMSSVGAAWHAQDPAALADGALQILEGERILLRPHAKLPGDKVLLLAGKLAAEKKDAATLERVKKAAELHGKKEVAANLAAAGKLAAAAARGQEEMSISVEATLPEAYSLFHEYAERIRAARIAGDAVGLENLEDEVQRSEMLTTQPRNQLLALIKRTSAALPKDQKPDAAIAALAKLGGESRGWFSDATGVSTPEPIRKIAPNGLSYTPKESYTEFSDPPAHPTCRIVNRTSSLCSYSLYNNSKPGKYFLGRDGYRIVTMPASLQYTNGYGKTVSGKLTAGATYAFIRDSQGMIVLKRQ